MFEYYKTAAGNIYQQIPAPKGKLKFDRLGYVDAEGCLTPTGSSPIVVSDNIGFVIGEPVFRFMGNLFLPESEAIDFEIHRSER